MRFAMVGEDVVDRLARGPLDLIVGVDERQTQSVGQPPSDRRLAAAHQTNQHDRALAQGLADRGRPTGVLARFDAFFPAESNHMVFISCLRGQLAARRGCTRGFWSWSFWEFGQPPVAFTGLHFQKQDRAWAAPGTASLARGWNGP